jgi:hypothetical protein
MAQIPPILEKYGGIRKIQSDQIRSGKFTGELLRLNLDRWEGAR